MRVMRQIKEGIGHFWNAFQRISPVWGIRAASLRK